MANKLLIVNHWMVPGIPTGTQSSRQLALPVHLLCIFSLMPSLCILTLENDVNKDLNLFDGDIKLTGEQRLALALGLDVDNPFGRASHRGRQWPGGVMVFAIHPTLSKSKPAAINNLNINDGSTDLALKRAHIKRICG